MPIDLEIELYNIRGNSTALMQKLEGKKPSDFRDINPIGRLIGYFSDPIVQQKLIDLVFVERFIPMKSTLELSSMVYALRNSPGLLLPFIERVPKDCFLMIRPYGRLVEYVEGPELKKALLSRVKPFNIAASHVDGLLSICLALKDQSELLTNFLEQLGEYCTEVNEKFSYSSHIKKRILDFFEGQDIKRCLLDKIMESEDYLGAVDICHTTLAALTIRGLSAGNAMKSQQPLDELQQSLGNVHQRDYMALLSKPPKSTIHFFRNNTDNYSFQYLHPGIEKTDGLYQSRVVIDLLKIPEDEENPVFHHILFWHKTLNQKRNTQLWAMISQSDSGKYLIQNKYRTDKMKRDGMILVLCAHQIEVASTKEKKWAVSVKKILDYGTPPEDTLFTVTYVRNQNDGIKISYQTPSVGDTPGVSLSFGVPQGESVPTLFPSNENFNGKPLMLIWLTDKKLELEPAPSNAARTNP